MHIKIFSILIIAIAILFSGCAEDGKDGINGAAGYQSNGTAFFANIKDTAIISSLTGTLLEFGSTDIQIQQSGTAQQAGYGHYHVIVDIAINPVAIGTAVPGGNANYIHFGSGANSATVGVGLIPGYHTLSLLVADGAHMPLDPLVVSAPVTVLIQ